MKKLSKQFLIIAFTIIVNSLFGQDIIYTISGEIDEQKVGLDSILFENLQNNTRLLFDNLSEQEDYVINLSTQTLMGSTGIDNLQFENGFDMLKNTAGELSVALNFTPSEPVNVSIFNVQGQRLFIAPAIKIVSGNEINVQLAKIGVYFVKLENSLGTKTFKALGSDNINSFGVELGSRKHRINTNLKSSLNMYDSDFSFEIGDGIKVSVYKSGYIAESNTQTISESVSLNFVFALAYIQGTFTDSRDSQTYSTIQIGGQVWFAENINYETTDSWWYENSEENGAVYGRLYTWEAALNACPSGWHLPSDDEWKKVEMALGMSQSQADEDGERGTDEGEKMKSTDGWYENGNGTNSSGFNVLPGGGRMMSGWPIPSPHFQDLPLKGICWSSREASNSEAWYRVLTYNSGQVGRYHYKTTSAFSVRCLKD